MPAKRSSKAAAPKQMRVSSAYGMVAPPDVIQQQRIDHAVAHTARIHQMLEKPSLSDASRKQLQQALDDYKDLVTMAGPASLAAAREMNQVNTPPDLQSHHLEKSLRHLGG